MSLTRLAAALGMHRDTLSHYIKQEGLDRKFSTISDGDLDTLVKTFCVKNPESGLRYLMSFIRRHGLRVQKCRVTSSLARIDPIGQQLQRQKKNKINRQAYRVARPHALWHIDGHHKLIKWGIVIHGCVDGFSRTVCLHLCHGTDVTDKITA